MGRGICWDTGLRRVSCKIHSSRWRLWENGEANGVGGKRGCNLKVE